MTVTLSLARLDEGGHHLALVQDRVNQEPGCLGAEQVVAAPHALFLFRSHACHTDCLWLLKDIIDVISEEFQHPHGSAGKNGHWSVRPALPHLSIIPADEQI